MKKKSKLPAIILVVALLAVSLGGGFAVGKTVQGSTFADQLAQELMDEFDITLPNSEPVQNPDGTIGSEIVQIQPVPETKDDGYATTDIYEKVNPSVVSITVYGSQSISALGSGTGIVMTADGYIITNAHVVEGGTSVNVVFHDDTNANGTIVGMDATTDLAVVKVDKSGLIPAEFGDSSALKVGERIVAIGNAGGLSSTITQGIVSGLDRDLGEGARSLKLIQVDAAINPGNSGGPLINRFGQVVGINSSKIADVDYEGIGFSIPINEAMPIIENIVDYGYVKGRAVLGISIVELNSTNGPINGLPSKGVCIVEFNEGCDLPSEGVQLRDVIIEANGVEIITSDDLLEQLDKFSPGDEFNLVIYR
ncbi:MAG: trypsin-like peptidase domain-containing protein, partial [Oscillospiraceae bacterium]|nr:trypsin-like peptidase domain-containing protein [Oscillospiraceae bacterium]